MQTRVFKHIAIVGRSGKVSVQATVNELIKRLMPNYHLCVNAETAMLLAGELNKQVQVLDNTALACCDMVIVVGGDGSMLEMAGLVAGTDTPILGVNRGRLGFLADIHPQALHKVEAVLSGAYQVDRRFLLQMRVQNNGVVRYEEVALNDVVLHAGKSVHTIDFELSIDGQRVYRQHADGLIVATPTGSTAYNLSAGGAIVHPSLAAICLTPMYPHTLSSRPLLVSDTSEIVLQVHKDNRTQPMVSPDGKVSVPLNADERLIITKYPHALTLLHPVGFDFYAACRTKLNWNSFADEFALTSS